MARLQVMLIDESQERSAAVGDLLRSAECDVVACLSPEQDLIGQVGRYRGPPGTASCCRATGWTPAPQKQGPKPIKLFLCGDVMTGRGIDQILPYPSSPELYEAYLSSAVDYVTIAERKNGLIPRKVAPDYIWGDVLPALEALHDDHR